MARSITLPVRLTLAAREAKGYAETVCACGHSESEHRFRSATSMTTIDCDDARCLCQRFRPIRVKVLIVHPKASR